MSSRGDHREDMLLTLDEYRALHPNKDESMAKAYQSGAYTMEEIGIFFWGTLYDREPGCAKIRGEARGNVGMLELTPRFCRSHRRIQTIIF